MFSLDGTEAGSAIVWKFPNIQFNAPGMSKFLVIVAGFWRGIIPSEFCPCSFVRGGYYHCWWGRWTKRKKITQHLTQNSAVFKALRMGLLRAVQEADWSFPQDLRAGWVQASSVLEPTAVSVWCPSWGTGPDGPSAHLQEQAVPKSGHAAVRTCSASAAEERLPPGELAAWCSGCTSSCWDTAYGSFGSLLDNWAVWPWQTLLLNKWKQDMTSAQHSPKSLSSFGPIPLQLKQFQLGDSLSSHRRLKGKMQCDSVKSLTYLSLGGVWTRDSSSVTTKGG